MRNEGFDLQLLARGVGADASRFETSPERPESQPPPSSTGGFRAAGGARHLLVRQRLAATLLAALALAAPPAAAAQEAVSGAELTALAERAADDESARAQLLAVERVDGRPVAMREAMEGARGAELEQRARLIAAGVTAAGEAAGAAESRREAQRVLEQRRYHGADFPRPFAGPLEWLGDRIQPVIDWINDRGVSVPGGPLVLWMMLAAGVLLAAAARSPARRSGAARWPSSGRAGRRCPPPTIRGRSSARPSAPSATATGSAPCACASAPACCGSTAGR